MDINTIVTYALFGLVSIVGYFIKGKLEGVDDAMKTMNQKVDDAAKTVNQKLETHQAEDNGVHMKMLEYYVTKEEYSRTIGRIFDMLTGISGDIKGLLTSKVDK